MIARMSARTTSGPKGLAVLLLVALAASADEPLIEHEPVPCTVPGRPLTLCALVTGDNQVAKARIYFRPGGEKFFSFIDMVFGGIRYCGTLPAPREGKRGAIEYYVQAVDSAFQIQRTSTYQIRVQPEGVCEFPPVEKDPARAGAIVVHATHKKQGKKLPDEFDSTGVSFVPVSDH